MNYVKTKLYILAVTCVVASASFAGGVPNPVEDEFGCGGNYPNPTLDENGQLINAPDSLPFRPALGEFTLLVIMVRFASHTQDDQMEYAVASNLFKHPDPVTPEMADTIIFDDRYPGPWNTPNFILFPFDRWQNYDGVTANDYFRAVSNDRMRISGEVTGPYILDDLDSSNVFYELFGPAMDSAIADGYNIEWVKDPFAPRVTGGDWDRILIMHPRYTDCKNCGQTGVATGRIAWVNGVMRYFGLLLHELRHTFKIKHSNGWFCGTNATWPTSDDTSCGIGILGDVYFAAGHPNSRVKEIMGWIDPEQVKTITRSGTYVLTPLETASGLKALRIPRDSAYYYYQFRAPIGFDESFEHDFFSDTRLDGLFGLRVDPFNTNFDQLLLDMPPLSEADNQQNIRVTLLEIGDTYIDSVIGVSVHVASLTGSDSAARVTVDVEILDFGDYDSDGFSNGNDNCPAIANNDQIDTDNDGVGDACDICPGFDDNIDSDGDGIPDGCDTDCCDIAGDADDNGAVNIADVTFLITRIFAGGSAPPCADEGDANGDNKVNIADVTFLIARIFAGGPAPVCGTTGS